MTSLLELHELVREHPGGFKLGPMAASFAPGEAVAVIGPNGAGKSTLFELVTGNLDATSGEVRFHGELLRPESAALKRRQGYLPQQADLPRWVSVREILMYACHLHGIENAPRRAQEAMEKWDCVSFAAKPLGALSYGMQKRAQLALATLHDPTLLVLDEPFSGLDLLHIRTLEDEITHRRTSERTTILSTHVPAFAAKLCNRLIVIQKGQLHDDRRWVDLGLVERMERMEALFFGESTL